MSINLLLIIPMVFFGSMAFFGMVTEAAGLYGSESTGHELFVDGISRNYIVYKPADSDKEKMPLMIVLHGGLGNAEHMERTSGMNEVADAGKFIVAYPNGISARFTWNRRLWNAGSCCGLAVSQEIGDVEFIQKMIEDIELKYPVDSSRIYVTGMSNGAMMAYRLACEIPEKIAAIIPVSGTIAIANCDAAKDVPVMHIHGTEDKYVPLEGGVGPKSVAGVPHTSLSDTIEMVTRARQCSESEINDEDPFLQVTSYRCSDGAPVVVVLIKNGGHSWPGGQGRRQQNLPGFDFSASREAWKFAKQFSKK